ncbi:RING finger protein 145-like isoform X2 [Oratosquilla oratoria]|uniref:RING finger protein 145-like isoform X2 n=1 Tax=Oratosquilla oratoria TaxID=337810 RepID=UPI003F76FB3D
MTRHPGAGLRGWKLNGEQFEAIATVILRVPGYVILDYWYQDDLRNCIPCSLSWPDIVSSGFAIFTVIQGVLVLLLPLEQLVSLYMHYLTIAVLAAADTFSNYYVEGEKQLMHQWPDYGTVSFQGFSNMLMLQKSLFDPHNDLETLFLRQQVAAIVFHTLVATLVTFFLDLEYNRDKILLLVYLVPVFARLAGFPVIELHLTHNFASCFVIFLTVQYIFLCVPRVFRFLKSVYERLVYMVELYGTTRVFITLWNRLFVPIQLLLFWIMLFVTQLYSHYVPYKKSVAVAHSTPTNTGGLTGEAWYFVMLQSAAEVCYTPLMLGGTCVAVSYASRGILTLTRRYTAGPANTAPPDDLVHSGWTEGVTMALLSIQTSLLEINMPERLAVLSILLLIVLSSLIQSMFELVEPFVLALSASGSVPLSRHARAVSACLFLLIVPLYMVYMFTLIFEQDFWLLLVLSACIMTSVQVLGLVTIYALLTYDSFCAEPWPSLDDLVYYTRAPTRVFEFIVAVFVVGAGIKECITGQWSWMNAVVLLIHFYFNVWQRLQQGWKSFLLRLEAAKKISALPQATAEQLKKYNDVCAICYAEMTDARVTVCKHLFHEPCLRKWLYVQDKCPMCYTPIALIEKPVEEKEEEEEREEAAPLTEGETVERDTDSLPDTIEGEVGANIPLPWGYEGEEEFC